ncbi:MAG TPA: protein phosphatase 2C domain-containing protein [Nitrospira sp.]|nr:serine/threonine-protein phosphatase [Nitrospira sp. NTP1]HQR13369.1 protein phosphatase 2C domain-containing protein [Nitrospira sp.]HQV11635.1 protein phosphatase 2C domain-containing protein [Nitrospira sp.]
MHAWHLTHGAASDVGLVRRVNEDRYHADPSAGLFIVCDGMGGHRAGEIASSRTVEIMPHHMAEAETDRSLPLIGASRPEFSPATNRLASAVRLANHRVHQEAARRTDYAGMGTTVVAVQLTGAVLSIAHVGDSRLYLIRDGAVQLLTVDHSLVQEQVQSGLLAAADMARVPHRHVLTRAVGVHPLVDVALGEMAVLPGDILLLCSDGLTAGVSADVILRVTQESADPQAMADRLIALSNAAGGTDNATVIVALVTQRSTSLWTRIYTQLGSPPA